MEVKYWYIYGLFDPITNELRYVGLTTGYQKDFGKRSFSKRQI
jgi:hypothetical protein